MNHFLLKLVDGAICREGFYEKCTHLIHDDGTVYFIVEDCGVKLGAYKAAEDWFNGEDAASAGMAVIIMVNSPLIPMKDIDAIFAPPLPFDEIDMQQKPETCFMCGSSSWVIRDDNGALCSTCFDNQTQ